jgi:flagellar basal-body rod protein FlgC
MISGIAASLSALSAFGKKLCNSARNVANCNTDGFKRLDAGLWEDKAGLPDTTLVQVQSPGSFVQDEGTMRETSNVDLTIEIPQMMISQRGYEANLKALKTQDEVLEAALDILA